MYHNASIALVIPARNEEKLIGPTLEAVPDLIDRVYVIDDCSTDHMAEVVLNHEQQDGRVTLLRHQTNLGPGGAIITGYRQAIKDGCEVVVVVGGDNQMPLHEVERFIDPLLNGEADYTKGNRFLLGQMDDTLAKMPKTRLIGNWIITILTKMASGYYKVYDVVDGYTATTRQVIEQIDWRKAWSGYGYPMDFLVRLNAYGFRVKDVPRTAIYLPGERQSQIKGFRYALKVSPMLLRNFFWRLTFKYLYHDFHPLALFYFLGIILLMLGSLVGLYIVISRIVVGPAGISGPTAILSALLIITGFQSFLFAMLFDMQEGV